MWANQSLARIDVITSYSLRLAWPLPWRVLKWCTCKCEAPLYKHPQTVLNWGETVETCPDIPPQSHKSKTYFFNFTAAFHYKVQVTLCVILWQRVIDTELDCFLKTNHNLIFSAKLFRQAFSPVPVGHLHLYLVFFLKKKKNSLCKKYLSIIATKASKQD